MRTKFDGFPTSIAFEIVFFDFLGANLPVCRYSGTTLFAFVAATKRAIGTPAFFAISPANRFPKFPEGTMKVGFFLKPPRCHHPGGGAGEEAPPPPPPAPGGGRGTAT